MNDTTKEILSSVNAFLKANELSDAVKLFKDMDQDGNQSVDKIEFVSYFENIKKTNLAAGKKQS